SIRTTHATSCCSGTARSRTTGSSSPPPPSASLPELSDKTGAMADIAEALRGDRELIVERLVERRGELPSFAVLSGRAVEDLAGDIRSLLDALCAAVQHTRPLDAQDIAFLVEAVEHQARR